MMPEEKQSLRKKIREKLRAMTVKERDDFSEKIVARLLEEKRWRDTKRIFGFYPLRSEPDWLPALLSEQELYIPKVFGETMRFYRFEGNENLVKNSLGVCEPAGEGMGAIPSEKDILLVPGIAFTKEGARLGQGGGYYDRFLQVFALETWGVCFPFQMLKKIPLEEHDVAVKRVFSIDE